MSEERAKATCDRMLAGISDSDDVTSAIAYLASIVSYMAVRCPEIVDSAIEHAEKRR